MHLVAIHHVSVDGRGTYTPGEIISAELSGEQRARLIRLGAIRVMNDAQPEAALPAAPLGHTEDESGRKPGEEAGEDADGETGRELGEEAGGDADAETGVETAESADEDADEEDDEPTAEVLEIDAEASIVDGPGEPPPKPAGARGESKKKEGARK